MHILIASAWDPTSGVLTVYRSLAKRLRSQGVRYSAFAFDGWREDTWWNFCDELIDGRSVTLAEVLMSGRFDLLHCVDTTYSPPYGVETWVRRARYRGPVVLMAQGARRELRERVHATEYVACSEEAATVLAQDADGPVVVIHNGYDEEVFCPCDVTVPERPLLVWVGRSYDPQKDVDLFLDAVELLPDYAATLVDTDPDADAVKRRVEQFGSRVRHVALIQPDELANIYRAAAASGGAFVSTSTSEGFPLAIVEAMACACPVIAPRIPGLDHLVDGRNALVYDRSTSTRGIAEALERLANATLRARLVGQAQREAERRWTSRAMSDAYLCVYQDALTRASSLPRSDLSDAIARMVWRTALAARPAWHRAERLLHG